MRNDQDKSAHRQRTHAEMCIGLCGLLWILGGIWILCWELWSYEPSRSKDSGVALVLLMQGLSFPLGVIFTFSVVAIQTLLSYIGVDPASVIGARGAMSFYWLGYFVSGYIQWFYLVPWLNGRGRVVIRKYLDRSNVSP